MSGLRTSIFFSALRWFGGSLFGLRAVVGLQFLYLTARNKGVGAVAIGIEAGVGPKNNVQARNMGLRCKGGHTVGWFGMQPYFETSESVYHNALAILQGLAHFDNKLGYYGQNIGLGGGTALLYGLGQSIEVSFTGGNGTGVPFSRKSGSLTGVLS